MQAPVEESPAAQQSLSAVAYDYLLLRLRGGQMGAKDRLVEAEIASRLGVSRVPVRQALLQLVAEGYLVTTPRGYRVPILSQQDIQEVFELRLLLEPRAAALAARDISAAQIQEIDLSIEEVQAAHGAHDASGFLIAGRRFRDGWLGAVRNSRLAASITRYADQVTLVRRMTLSDFNRQRSVIASYQELRQAFAGHDSVVAHDVMLRLVLAAQHDFSDVQAQAHADAEAPP